MCSLPSAPLPALPALVLQRGREHVAPTSSCTSLTLPPASLCAAARSRASCFDQPLHITAMCAPPSALLSALPALEPQRGLELVVSISSCTSCRCTRRLLPCCQPCQPLNCSAVASTLLRPARTHHVDVPPLSALLPALPALELMRGRKLAAPASSCTSPRCARHLLPCFRPCQPLSRSAASS
jgi:hypothetical protein